MSNGMTLGWIYTGSIYVKGGQIVTVSIELFRE